MGSDSLARLLASLLLAVVLTSVGAVTGDGK